MTLLQTYMYISQHNQNKCTFQYGKQLKVVPKPI